MSRFFLILILLLFCGCAIAQQSQPPSLAEQAAALRKKTATPSGKPPLGKKGDCDYKYEDAGLELKCIDGWEGLDRGEANVGVAELQGLRHFLNPDSGMELKSVFAMHDPSGTTVVLTVIGFQPGKLPKNVKTDLQKLYEREEPGITFRNETTLLDDTSHHFGAFRAPITFQGTTYERSIQAIAMKDDLLQFTVFADSPQKLIEALHKLQPRIQWIGAPPAK
jgi:hypothetical protein